MSKKPAPCHPDRPFCAKGLCKNCYNKLAEVRERKNAMQYHTTPIERAKQKARRATEKYKSGDRVRKQRYRNTVNGRKVFLDYFATDRHKYLHRRVILARVMRDLGLTIEQYDAMVISQNGVCQICGNPPSAKRRLSVDHCHKTGKLRALLCGNCNTGLGMFKDDPDRLLRAMEYLKYHQGKVDGVV